MHQASRLIGSPAPASRSLFPAVLRFFSRYRPLSLARKVHPLVSSAPLQSAAVPSPALCRLATNQKAALPGGWPSLFATSARRVCSTGFHSHRNSVLTFFTCSTALAHQASWVCFTPLPRPGFRSSGVLPLTQPFRLVAESCPLVVGAECCRQFPASATPFCLALRAFSPCEDPVSSRRCLAFATTRSPLELLPPPGALPRLCDDAFTSPAARDLTESPSQSLSLPAFSVPESR
jgi:hypothetical protein